MAKMTKTQQKNALKAIRSKSFRLIEHRVLSINEYDKINTIVNRAMNRLK